MHCNALWVRLNVKREIGKFLPRPSFYPCPNISDRFPSHFIFVGDKMNISQSTQKGKRDELNSFKYFTQVTGAQIFAKHQFQLSNLDFTMKPASLSNPIFSFFPRHGLYFHPTKDRCSTRPSSPFFTFVLILVIFAALKSSNFFLWKIWDIRNSKRTANMSW